MEPSVLYRRIRKRCDLQPAEFLTDDEIGEMAEESYHELWDILITLLGEEAPWEFVDVNTVANQAYVDISRTTGCYRMVRIDAALGGDEFVPIRRGQFGSDAWSVTSKAWQHATGVRYYARRSPRGTAAQRIGANTSFAAWRIYFNPTPSAVYALRLFYIIPPLIVLTDDDPQTYSSFPDEWPEYVVADVAAKIAVKQEADPAPHERERERQRERIELYSKPHQVSQAQSLQDGRKWQRNEFDDDSDFMGRR